MKVLDIQNNTVIINPECLVIPQFSVIWERDKSEDKNKAFKEITWVYMMGNYNTIYRSYDSELRQEVVSEDIFGDKTYKPSKEVLSALEKYKELQSTPSLRYLEACLIAMEQTEHYLRHVNYDILDKMGKPKYKYTEISKGIKEASGIIDSIEKLREKVKLEQQTSAKIKAGGVEGMLADME